MELIESPAEAGDPRQTLGSAVDQRHAGAALQAAEHRGLAQ
jgi:hypothetical protein